MSISTETGHVVVAQISNGKIEMNQANRAGSQGNVIFNLAPGTGGGCI